jgi:hypothetical protein
MYYEARSVALIIGLSILFAEMLYGINKCKTLLQPNNLEGRSHAIVTAMKNVNNNLQLLNKSHFLKFVYGYDIANNTGEIAYGKCMASFLLNTFNILGVYTLLTSIFIAGNLIYYLR